MDSVQTRSPAPRSAATLRPDGRLNEDMLADQKAALGSWNEGAGKGNFYGCAGRNGII